LEVIRLSNDKDKLAEYQFGLTCEKAIESVPVSVIKKIDPMAFQFSFDMLLSILWDNVSVNQKFSIGKIPMIREAIFTRYYFLTIDEVAYVLKNGTIGKYKKEYNKLDLETLMTWFELYDTSERMEWLDKRNHNQKIESIKQLEKTTAVVSKEVTDKIIKSLVGDHEEKERNFKSVREKFIESRKNKRKIHALIFKKNKVWNKFLNQSNSKQK